MNDNATNSKSDTKSMIFSTPMVQALLAGRKSLARRLMKPQPTEYDFKRIKDWNADMIPKAKYRKGDKYMIRETWQHTSCLNINPEDENYGYVYKADNQPWEDLEGWKWLSPLVMPKKAARVYIQITDVRVEKLMDISEQDAIAEGIKYLDRGSVSGWKSYMLNCGTFADPRLSFFSLWRSFHGVDSVESNPYVWVLSFDTNLLVEPIIVPSL